MSGSHRKAVESAGRPSPPPRLRWVRVLSALLSLGVLAGAVALERSGRYDHVLAVDTGTGAALNGRIPAGMDELPGGEESRTTRSKRPEPGSGATITAGGEGGETGTGQGSKEVPEHGTGQLDVVPGTSPGEGDGTVFPYRVEIERGLPFEGEAIAETIHETLTDERGWQNIKQVRFERVEGEAPVRIIVASPSTTDELCAPLDTQGEVSCRNGDRVVLNAKRWAYGVPHFEDDLETYRQYLVNHEVGHALGEDHVDCPTPGAPAPVMLQQTKGLDGCLPNAWPSIGTP